MSGCIQVRIPLPNIFRVGVVGLFLFAAFLELNRCPAMVEATTSPKSAIDTEDPFPGIVYNASYPDSLFSRVRYDPLDAMERHALNNTFPPPTKYKFYRKSSALTSIVKGLSYDHPEFIRYLNVKDISQSSGYVEWAHVSNFGTSRPSSGADGQLPQLRGPGNRASLRRSLFENQSGKFSGETSSSVGRTPLSANDHHAGPWVRISPRHDRQMMLVFGEHGRELITAELGVIWLCLLGQNTQCLNEWSAEISTILSRPDVMPPGWPTTVSDIALRIVQSVDLFVAYNIGRWSRDAVENGQTCQRKNLNGVDLNRNYAFLWNEEGATKPVKPTADEYPGPRAFSEPESRIVRDVSWSLPGISAFYNVHSGEQSMYIPWDHRPNVPVRAQRSSKILDILVPHTCPGCPHGSAGAAATYLVHGSSMDWFFAERGVNYSYTFEIYGGSDGVCQRPQYRSPSCMCWFNPMDDDVFSDTIVRWTAALFSSVAHVIHDLKDVPVMHRPVPKKLDAVDTEHAPISPAKKMAEKVAAEAAVVAATLSRVDVSPELDVIAITSAVYGLGGSSGFPIRSLHVSHFAIIIFLILLFVVLRRLLHRYRQSSNRKRSS